MQLYQLGYLYEMLLRHPFDEWRAKNQHLYVLLRDDLAELRGETPEETQSHYEALASNDPDEPSQRLG